jgi:hypothetical protein
MRFMAGDESQDYADNPENWAIYDVNTVANNDPTICSRQKFWQETLNHRVRLK